MYGYIPTHECEMRSNDQNLGDKSTGTALDKITVLLVFCIEVFGVNIGLHVGTGEGPITLPQNRRNAPNR